MASEAPRNEMASEELYTINTAMRKAAKELGPDGIALVLGVSKETAIALYNILLD